MQDKNSNFVFNISVKIWKGHFTNYSEMKLCSSHWWNQVVCSFLFFPDTSLFLYVQLQQ